MTDDKPEGQAKWLEKVEKDQNISGLDTIDDTLKNEAGRHWFPSQTIQPNIELGSYNKGTKKYELNNNYHESECDSDAVSQAQSTFTVPAGEIWRVHMIKARNNTRAASHSCVITFASGQTLDMRSAAGATISNHDWLWGGQQTTGNTSGTGGISHLYLYPGATIVIVDLAFVAADVVLKEVVHETLVNV